MSTLDYFLVWVACIAITLGISQIVKWHLGSISEFREELDKLKIDLKTLETALNNNESLSVCKSLLSKLNEDILLLKVKTQKFKDLEIYNILLDNISKKIDKVNIELNQVCVEELSASPFESFQIIIENDISINIFFFFIFFFFVYFNGKTINKSVILINVFNFFLKNFKNLALNMDYETYFFLIITVFKNSKSFYILELFFNLREVIFCPFNKFFFNFKWNYIWFYFNQKKNYKCLKAQHHL